MWCDVTGNVSHRCGARVNAGARLAAIGMSAVRGGTSLRRKSGPCECRIVVLTLGPAEGRNAR